MTNKNGNYCVYIHTCKINHKAYIGITNQQPEKRWGKNGYRYLEKHSNGEYVQPIFARALNKYKDWDNDWEHIIFMDGLSEYDAKQTEIKLIALFKTNVCKYGDKYGYNCTDGGEGCSGRIPSEETRKKISESHKGENNPMYGVRLTGDKNHMYGRTGDKHPNYGKHQTEETKKKISKANSGRHPSDETRAKMSKSQKGRVTSEETKQKISKANKGKIASGDKWNARPIVQLDDDGNLIKEWDCIASAYRALGICRSSIPHCLMGKQKSAGGFKWMDLSDYQKLNEV
jgi:group I intron endonuclease